MERRKWPIPDPRHQPMLDRIDMNIIDMTRDIVVIANGVLPIAPLPTCAVICTSFPHG